MACDFSSADVSQSQSLQLAVCDGSGTVTNPLKARPVRAPWQERAGPVVPPMALW